MFICEYRRFPEQVVYVSALCWLAGSQQRIFYQPGGPASPDVIKQGLTYIAMHDRHRLMHSILAFTGDLTNARTLYMPLLATILSTVPNTFLMNAWIFSGVNLLPMVVELTMSMNMMVA